MFHMKQKGAHMIHLPQTGDSGNLRTSHQASGGRHLAPAMPGYPIRVCIWEQHSAEAGGWRLTEVFEARDFAEAEFEALEVCTEPYPDGVSAMHYVIGEVAS